ncbi:MAG: hypothetical protein HQL27_07750, partial [Candidatus Omnitrophica bacterium]|nr:hypothetical protein [Candidatus Omnitrophota bacterium]
MKKVLRISWILAVIVFSFSQITFARSLISKNEQVKTPQIIIKSEGLRTGTAPVFDPVSSFDIPRTTNSYLAVAATDSENDTMTLSANGSIVSGAPIYRTNRAGRIEAIIPLYSSSNGTYNVTVSANDGSGQTFITIPVNVVTSVSNTPISFSPISHLSVKTGEEIVLPISISAPNATYIGAS